MQRQLCPRKRRRDARVCIGAPQAQPQSGAAESSSPPKVSFARTASDLRMVHAGPTRVSASLCWSKGGDGIAGAHTPRLRRTLRRAAWRSLGWAPSGAQRRAHGALMAPSATLAHQGAAQALVGWLRCATLRHRRARGMGGAQAHLPAFAAARARLLPLFSDGAVWEPSRDAPARETRHMPYRQAL